MREPAFTTSHVKCYLGDCVEVMREMPDESVDCVVTSPPYWGLRDYGVAGQIGLERTPPDYVDTMVEVFREVRRVLTDRGTLWLNLGDSYHSPDRGGYQRSRTKAEDSLQRSNLASDFPYAPHRMPQAGLKSKDMVGIPWRVAFALQADGWYLRSDIIWSKPNPMPESVTDRPTKAHEYVFLFSKSRRYFYDAQAIAEPFVSSDSDLRKMAEGKDRIGGKHKSAEDPLLMASSLTNVGRKRSVGNGEAAAATLQARRFPGIGPQHAAVRNRGEDYEAGMAVSASGRNARSVWTIATQPYPEAHFATFPEQLARRCILAGAPEHICATCAKPRARLTSATYTNPGNRRSNGRRDGEGFRETGVRVMVSGRRLEKQTTTTGWTDCGHGEYRPGVVLDPFAGTGTTLAVARDLGRRGVGIELSPEYVRLIERRCAQNALDFTEAVNE